MPPLNLQHRVHVPELPAGQAAPTLVMVHGWKGNENVMSIFERTAPAGVALFYPRAPFTVETESYGWFTLDDAATVEPGVAALEAFVRGLTEAYPVDPGRLALMGFSQGAAVSLSLLLKAPKLALGAAALAGFLPEPARAWATEGRLSGKRVFMASGTEDETVPIAWAREAAGVLRQAGAEVDDREYAVGHKLNAQGTRDLKDWLGGLYGSAA